MTSSSSSHKCDLFRSSILTLDSLYLLLYPSDGNLSVSGSWMSPKGIDDPTRVGSFSPVQINRLDSLQRNGCVDGMASPAELIVGFSVMLTFKQNIWLCYTSSASEVRPALGRRWDVVTSGGFTQPFYGFMVLESPMLSCSVSIFPQLHTAFPLELRGIPRMVPTKLVC